MHGKSPVAKLIERRQFRTATVGATARPMRQQEAQASVTFAACTKDESIRRIRKIANKDPVEIRVLVNARGLCHNVCTKTGPQRNDL